MAAVAEAVLNEFASIVGEAQMTTEAVVRERFAIEGKAPGCVAYPSSAEQVARTLLCAADHDLAVIACGGATGLGIGNPPARYDIALCMGNLNGVQFYEPSDLTAGIGAGMKLKDLRNLLKPDGLWLPLDPSGSEHATLGGILATNASGPLRHFYGAPRDMVVGMQVATTEGKLIKTGGRVVKNVAGYDLGKLLIGSYGTLGVITEVNLKLFPLPAERGTFVISVGDLGMARDLRRKILASPVDLLRMVLLDAEAVGIIDSACSFGSGNREPELWLEAGGFHSVIERTWNELDKLGRAAGARVCERDEESSHRAWRVISDFSNWLASTYPGAVVMRCTIPIARNEEFLSLAQQEAQNENVRTASVALSGAGIIYFGLLGSSNADRTADLISHFRKSAEKAGGALILISAGTDVKRKVDGWGVPATGLDLMRKMKAAWDPAGILAPGRFVGSI